MDSVVVDECLWWKTAAAIITTIAVNDGCEFVGLSVCLRLPRRRRSQPRDLACELAVGCTCQCKRNGCAHDGANTIEVRRKVELSSAHHASFILACHRPSTRTLLCSRSTTLPRSCADPEQCTVPWHAERQRWGIEECLSIIIGLKQLSSGCSGCCATLAISIASCVNLSVLPTAALRKPCNNLA